MTEEAFASVSAYVVEVQELTDRLARLSTTGTTPRLRAARNGIVAGQRRALAQLRSHLAVHVRTGALSLDEFERVSRAAGLLAPQETVQ
jgi:hypothetical protein